MERYSKRSNFFPTTTTTTPLPPLKMQASSKKRRRAPLFELKLEPPLKLHKRSHPAEAATEALKQADSRLWTDKYSPSTSDAVAGNKAVISRLRSWLQAWETKATPKCKAGRQGVLISGPPGVGKTRAATIVSQELGFQPVLVCGNAMKGKPERDRRLGLNGKLSNMISELINGQRTLSGKAVHAKAVLILDELDGIDEAGCQACLQFLKRCNVPIICICNNRYARCLRSLRSCCLELQFQRPREDEVLKLLTTVAEKERVLVDKEHLAVVVNTAQRDIRQALNQVQYIFAGLQQCRGRLCLDSKDEFLSSFTVVDSLCAAPAPGVKARCLEERINMISHDEDFVFLLVQENYVDCRPCNQRGSSPMDALSRAADYLSVGDVLKQSMHHYQQWDLSMMFCAIVALTCSSFVQGSRQCLTTGQRCHLRFPQWLTKNSVPKKDLTCRQQELDHCLPPLCGHIRKMERLTEPVDKAELPSAEMFAILKATKKAVRG